MKTLRMPRAKLFVSFAVMASLLSCSNLSTKSSSKDSSKSEDIVAELDRAGSQKEDDEKAGVDSETLRAADIENYTIEEVIRIEEPNTATLYDNSRYDFPITMNSRVEGWIDYFTGRGRPHMERYLGRSSRYIPMMKVILKQAGLPEDLVYLALIESGFNLRANSRAKAVGPWQFMKATGTRYGLRVDAWIDERRDPVRSTEAAARYLKDLYLMFESWYLAASAYNAGEYKILRSINTVNSHNFWRLCETRLIRRETKDYVPKLIAAAIIGKNPARYGFEDVAYLEPLEFETVTVDFPMPLAEIAKLVDAPEEELEDLNPELRRGMIPPGVEEYELRIPVGSRALVERAVAAMRTRLAQADLPVVEHRVRRGDTLDVIARKYRIRARDLADANNLGKREKLVPGSTVLIPKKGGSTELAATRATVEKPSRVASRPGPEGFITHVVKRGESLWSISEKYDVTVQDLFKWNDLQRSRIFPGKRIRIKAPAGSGDQATESKRSASPRKKNA